MLEVMDRVTNRSKHEDVITIVKRIAIKMGIISKSHTQEQKLKDIIVSSFQVSIVFDGNRNNGLQYVTLYLWISNVDGSNLKAERLQYGLTRMLGSSLFSIRSAINCSTKGG